LTRRYLLQSSKRKNSSFVKAVSRVHEHRDIPKVG
jgi:hypothetical protein